MFARSAVNTYAAIGVQTQAMSASPVQLIVMLFDGARTAIAQARYHIESGDVARKGQAISKAIDIVESGLRAVLDHAAGGDVSSNLDTLYEYMGRRLTQANLRNDIPILDEVDRLLADLGSAWSDLARRERGHVHAPGAGTLAEAAGY